MESDRRQRRRAFGGYEQQAEDDGPTANDKEIHRPWPRWLRWQKINRHRWKKRYLGIISFMSFYVMRVLFSLSGNAFSVDLLLANIQHQWYRHIVWNVFPPQPSGTLSGSIGTRRQNLDLLETSSRENYDREMNLANRHLEHLERDMSHPSNATERDETRATRVLLWSGSYPVWNARVKPNGFDEKCNIPCEWTTNRDYDPAKITGLVCMLYGVESGRCRDIPAHFHSGPIMGVTWENTEWRQLQTRLDEMPRSQISKMKEHVPYNLISSHELDSHIPVLYPQLADFIDKFHVQAFDDMVAKYGKVDQIASVMFAISNCQAPLRPDRLHLIWQLGRYYPTSSFGSCLGHPKHHQLEWNSRLKYGSQSHIDEMSKYLFVYAPENTYGIDYVTEKIFLPLIAGSVPIYMGAPNIAAFIPDRNAVIHVSDFDTVEELGGYLAMLSKNRTLLVERHHAWRTRPLPERLTDKLLKLVDRKSDHSFMCKVCNCFWGRIGCPNLFKRLQ